MEEPFNPYSILPPNLKIFDTQSLMEVERLASGLSEEEVLDYFGLSQEGLSLSLPDKEIFTRTFKRGRTIGKMRALENLFIQMGSKGGAPACLTYLKQVSPTWVSIDESSTIGNKNFVFTVNMDS